MKYKKSAELIVLRSFSGEGVNPNLKLPILPPQYVVGFVDGEGCFSVSFNRHSTLKRRIEVRPEFEIELRSDDSAILARVQRTLGCGKIYWLDYQRYQWKPHVKLRVSRQEELVTRIIPFFTKYKLQSKKAKIFELFKRIVEMVSRKEHLTDTGYKKILVFRQKMQMIGKKAKIRLGTARVRESRLPSGVRHKTEVRGQK